MADGTANRVSETKRARARASLVRQTLRWHWISAAICLIGMLLFAITGVTLNHADAMEGSTRTVERTAVLTPAALAALRSGEVDGGPLPPQVRGWLHRELDVKVPAAATVEWAPGEAYLALPRPGGDAWVSIDTATGKVLHERTTRGWVAYLNDLHKGRDTGTAWRWFIDIFALGTMVFCITGLLLLQLHSHGRRLTWPLVFLGLLAPSLIALIFIH